MGWVKGVPQATSRADSLAKRPALPNARCPLYKAFIRQRKLHVRGQTESEKVKCVRAAPRCATMEIDGWSGHLETPSRRD